VRGCGSTMSTGHTPRFERIGRANESVRKNGERTEREREREREGGEREGGKGEETGTGREGRGLTRRCYRDEESSYSCFKCIDDVLMAHQVGVMRVALTELLRSLL